MRIGFVVHQFFPRHFTGTEQYVRALALEARRRGHDARVFTREPALELTAAARARVDDEVDGVPVRRVALARDVPPNPVLGDWDQPLLALEAARWADDFRPDVMHIFHLAGLGASALGALLARREPAVVHATDFWIACPTATLTLPDGRACDGPPEGGLGCFQCIHGGVGARVDAEELRGELTSLAAAAGPLHLHRRALPAMALALAGRRERLAAACARAAAVTAPSRFLYQTLARHGVPERVLRLAPYGVDLSRLAGYRRRASGPVTFGFFGTLAPHKGALVLVRALRRTAADVRVVVRGKVGEFPEYGRELQAAAAGDARITFAPPFAPAELGAALSDVDALVVPSLWHENAPFVALEALAAGVPVLASNRGGLSEIVGEGRGGALFEAGDDAALAVRLEACASRGAIDAARNGITPPRTIAAAFDDLSQLAAHPG